MVTPNKKLKNKLNEQDVEKSGLVKEHVEAFIKLAREKKVYLLFRKVNKFSTSLIKNGAATKGLNVHGKSSDWGPMAGFIPLDQDLSKKFGNVKGVNLGNSSNRTSLNEASKSIGTVALTLSEERLNELQSLGVLSWDKNTKSIAITGKGAQHYEFRLKGDGTNPYSVEYRTLPGTSSTLGVNKPWRLLDVMGAKINGSVVPLTADYDMFMVAPSLDSVVKKSDPNEKLTLKKVVEKVQTQGLGQADRRVADPNLGKVPEWMKGLIADLNKSVVQTGRTGGNVIHHGAETDNPFPEKEEQIFVITPEGEAFLTKDWEDTQTFIHNIRQKGFITWVNRLYNKLIFEKGSLNYITWGERPPTLDEFDRYILEVAKIPNSNTLVSELKKNISPLLKSFYGMARASGESDNDFFIRQRKEIIALKYTLEALSSNYPKGDHNRTAVELLFHRIDAYDRLILRPSIKTDVSLSKQIDNVTELLSTTLGRINVSATLEKLESFYLKHQLDLSKQRVLARTLNQLVDELGRGDNIDKHSAEALKENVEKELSLAALDAKQVEFGIIDDSVIKSYRSGEASSQKISSRVVSLLQGKGIKASVIGLLVFENELSLSPKRHYAVKAHINGEDIVFDLASHKFGGVDPMVEPLAAWKEKFASLRENRETLIRYNEYPSLDKAKIDLSNAYIDIFEKGEAMTSPRWFLRSLVAKEVTDIKIRILKHYRAEPAKNIKELEKELSSLTRYYDREIIQPIVNENLSVSKGLSKSINVSDVKSKIDKLALYGDKYVHEIKSLFDEYLKLQGGYSREIKVEELIKLINQAKKSKAPTVQKKEILDKLFGLVASEIDIIDPTLPKNAIDADRVIKEVNETLPNSTTAISEIDSIIRKIKNLPEKPGANASESRKLWEMTAQEFGNMQQEIAIIRNLYLLKGKNEEYFKALIEKGLGNCGDKALYAAFLLKEKYNYSGSIEMLKLGGEGDHAFLRVGGNSPDAIIIDPWAGQHFSNKDIDIFLYNPDNEKVLVHRTDYELSKIFKDIDPTLVMPENYFDKQKQRSHELSRIKVEKVETWGKYKVIPKKSSTTSQYDSQIIIQLENDAIVAESASRLAGKHPDKTVIVQLDKDGKYRVIYGDVKKLGGKVRWQLVGHGGKDEARQTAVLSNYDPDQLANLITDFKARFAKEVTGNTLPERISLVGCDLETEKYRESFVKDLLVALDKKGLKTTLSARAGEVAVNIEGRKVSLVEPENPLATKKVVASWNKDGTVKIHSEDREFSSNIQLLKKKLTKTNLTMDEILSIHKELATTQSQGTDSILERQLQAKASHDVMQKLHQEIYEMHELTASGREKAVSEVVKGVHASHYVETFNKTVTDLIKTNNLGGDWVATSHINAEDGTLLFLNKKDGTSKFITLSSTERDAIEAFSHASAKLSESIEKNFSFDKATGRFAKKADVGDVEAPSTMNFAFLIKSVMDFESSGFSHASLATKMEIMASFTQMGLGGVHDLSKLVSLIEQAEKMSASSIVEPMRASSGFFTGVNFITNGIFLYTSIVELSKAKDPVSKATLKASIGTLALQIGVDLAALLTGSAILAPLTVPLVGIVAAIPSLVHNFAVLKEKFDATAKYFQTLEDDVTGDIVTVKDGIASVGSTAVVKEVDFLNKKIYFGTLLTSKIKSGSGSGHTRPGSWDNYFSIPYFSEKESIDIYKGLGKSHAVLNTGNSRVFVLPAALSQRLQVHLHTIPLGHRPHNSSLDKLRKYYGSHFVWGVWGGGTDHGIQINAQKTKYYRTPISVTLDKENRTLVFETVWDNYKRSLLDYKLVGSGGIYDLVLPYKAANIDVVASNTSSEIWRINADALAYDFSLQGKDGNKRIVQQGDFKYRLLHDIRVTKDKVSIGTQEIHFSGQAPQRLSILNRDKAAKVGIMTLVDMPSGNLSFSISMESETDFGEALKIIEKLPVKVGVPTVLQMANSASLSLIKLKGGGYTVDLFSKSKKVAFAVKSGFIHEVAVDGTELLFGGTAPHYQDNPLLRKGKDALRSVLERHLGKAIMSDLDFSDTVKIVSAKLQSDIQDVIVFDTKRKRVVNATFYVRSCKYLYQGTGVGTLAILATGSGHIDVDLPRTGVFAALPISEIEIVPDAQVTLLRISDRLMNQAKVNLVATPSQHLEVVLPSSLGEWRWQIDGPDLILEAGGKTFNAVDAFKTYNYNKQGEIRFNLDGKVLTVEGLLTVLKHAKHQSPNFGAFLGTDSAKNTYFQRDDNTLVILSASQLVTSLSPPEQIERMFYDEQKGVILKGASGTLYRTKQGKLSVVNETAEGIWVADTDGDGEEELVTLKTDGVNIEYKSGTTTLDNFQKKFGWLDTERYPIFLADVDGDGKKEIVAFGYDALFRYTPAQKKYDQPYKGNFSHQDGWHNQSNYKRTVRDINGDGKADIIGFDKETASDGTRTYAIEIALSSGNADKPFGGHYTANNSADPAWKQLHDVMTKSDWRYEDVVDYNGDGIGDLYFAEANGRNFVALGRKGEKNRTYFGNPFELAKLDLNGGKVKNLTMVDGQLAVITAGNDVVKALSVTKYTRQDLLLVMPEPIQSIGRDVITGVSGARYRMDGQWLTVEPGKKPSVALDITAQLLHLAPVNVQTAASSQVRITLPDEQAWQWRLVGDDLFLTSGNRKLKIADALKPSEGGRTRASIAIGTQSFTPQQVMTQLTHSRAHVYGQFISIDKQNNAYFQRSDYTLVTVSADNSVVSFSMPEMVKKVYHDAQKGVILKGASGTLYRTKQGKLSVVNEQDGIWVADTDGDGEEELVTLRENGINIEYKSGTLVEYNFQQKYGWLNTNKLPIFFGDIDGNGEKELIAFGREVYIYSPSERRFIPSYKGNFTLQKGWHNQSNNKRTVTDINGDSKADIIGFDKETAADGRRTYAIKVAMSSGRRSSPYDGYYVANKRITVAWKNLHDVMTKSDWRYEGVVDYNGDGISDLYFAEANGRNFVALGSKGEKNRTYFDNPFELAKLVLKGGKVKNAIDINGDGVTEVVIERANGHVETTELAKLKLTEADVSHLIPERIIKITDENLIIGESGLIYSPSNNNTAVAVAGVVNKSGNHERVRPWNIPIPKDGTILAKNLVILAKGYGWNGVDIKINNDSICFKAAISGETKLHFILDQKGLRLTSIEDTFKTDGASTIVKKELDSDILFNDDKLNPIRNYRRGTTTFLAVTKRKNNRSSFKAFKLQQKRVITSVGRDIAPLVEFQIHAVIKDVGLNTNTRGYSSVESKLLAQTIAVFDSSKEKSAGTDSVSEISEKAKSSMASNIVSNAY
ncbi:calmodulin-sensitive adenylate cyclase [Vibrionales bacterium SWAT-3]|nr:calmodulin-sensitive adenylate cyclase [Vibrionales bacterium SWAT-3]